MTTVIIMNAGSSSLKVSALRPDDEVADTLSLDRWDGSPDHPELAEFLARAGRDAAAVAHRVVHGGSRFTAPVRIDDSVVAAIEGLTELAPLHQPRALAGIEAARQALPGVPGVACFDTAFHAGLPDAAARYALPDRWTTRFGLRRYGFHGLSHAYAARRAGAMLRRDPADLRIVTCHLGAGASLAAVRARALRRYHDGLHPARGPGHGHQERQRRPRPARLAAAGRPAAARRGRGRAGAGVRAGGHLRAALRRHAGHPAGRAGGRSARAAWRSRSTCTGCGGRLPRWPRR